MARIILLDSGVIGLALAPPSKSNARQCIEWIDRLTRGGVSVVVPEITYYEVKRGLLFKPANSALKLEKLESICQNLEMVPVKRAAWDKAAEFWAIVRQAGKPTAQELSLDADAVLAAMAVTIVGPGDLATIATTNIGHLGRFPGVVAQRWNLVV